MTVLPSEKVDLFKKITLMSAKVVEKYLPDPYVFAAVLTPIVFLWAIISTQQSPVTMLTHWYGGLWNLHTFAMQMVLVVVLGHTLALSDAFRRLLRWLAGIPQNGFQSIMVVTFVSAFACWLNWGFGLIVGALYAREIAKRVAGVDYRLLVASAYSGFLVWHAGLSGSIPLKIATADKDLSLLSGGVLTEAVGLEQTIFAPFTIVPTLLIVFTLPLINALMHPNPENTVAISPELLAEDEQKDLAWKGPTTPADKLDSSLLVSMTLGAMGLASLVVYLARGGRLNLNLVIFIFMVLSIILHRNPRRLVRAVKEAIKGSAGIVIQFPLYAGIMGMMMGENGDGVSLAMQITEVFAQWANASNLPFFSFIAAAVLNFFVPSGGGHWVIQGPIFMPTAEHLGADFGRTAMGIAWGDALTNMLQPFWALPALGLAGLSARNIMGFCLISMIYAGIIISFALLLL